MDTWEEHINRCMELYDSRYAELCGDTELSDRLTLECDCYSDDELEGVLNRNKDIANIFGEGRDVFLSCFISREEDYYPDRIDHAKENHAEAAVSAAEQYFIIEFVQNQLNDRLL